MLKRTAPAGATSQTGGVDPDTIAVAKAQADSLWDGYLDQPIQTGLVFAHQAAESGRLRLHSVRFRCCRSAASSRRLTISPASQGAAT